MDNYRRVLDEIGEAALAGGRNPSDVLLVAVTKSVAWEKASELYRMGHRDFAENRLQKAFEMMSEAPSDCRWHLIGTLQTKKVRKAIGRFALIHSVDSISLLNSISKCSLEAETKTPVLLQVNTSGEASKHGMTTAECLSDYDQLSTLPGVLIEGLMTIAPLTDDVGAIRRCFSSLRQLRDQINDAYPQKRIHHLSMGMSNDFKIAIAEGATIVRLGTALFNH